MVKGNLLIVVTIFLACVPNSQSMVYVHKDVKLPSEKISSNLTLPSLCSCKWYCQQINCTCYQSVPTGRERWTDCSFTTETVPIHELATASGSMVVCESDYQLYGSQFYKVVKTLKFRSDSMKLCLSEGGQLPVLNNDQRIQEFKRVVAGSTPPGTETNYWIGLYKDTTGPTAGRMSWKFNNGSRPLETSITAQDPDMSCFRYTTGVFNPDNHINNYVICDTKSWFVCQRDY